MRSLSVKLILAFLAVSLVGVGLIAFRVKQGTREEFNDMIYSQLEQQLATRLTRYYSANGSWSGLSEYYVVIREEGQTWEPAPWENRRRPPQQVIVTDATGRTVMAGVGYRVGEPVAPERMADAVPLEVDGQVVGRLLVPREPSFVLSMEEDRFVQRVDRLLIWATGGAVLVALFLSVVLSSALTRPLRELTGATHALIGGKLGQQVRVRSRDELGELALAFNQMSTKLARAENLRRQMSADIAHELRTPLSLVLGYAEALEEGALPPSPETFRIIAEEAQRLTRLVGDLRTLSLSDAGELALHPQPIPPAALLERTAMAHRPQADQVELVVDAAPDLPPVAADVDRLNQVLGNLLSNALRHTPAGGRITLAARREGDYVRLTVQDSGSGIPPEDLPYVFERFYRADKARQREQGGSGLGLAIVRSLVESHGGHIWAESTPGEGAAFHFTLPISQEPPAAEVMADADAAG